MSARDTALRVLSAGRTNGAWADAGLNAALVRDGLAGPEAALATRLVYGVLQNRALLDFYLGGFCTQKLSRLQPPLADILRIGAYQILFLDKVPDHAAVSEAVEQARRNGRAAASGLVNAVLRRLSREKEALPAIPDRDETESLSIRYSHPKWLVKRLLALLGREEAEEFLALDNGQPPVAVQVNTCRFDTGHVMAALEAEGVRAEEHPWLPDCLLLSGTGSVQRLRAFQAGAVYVQDAAARLAVLAAGLSGGSRVLDVCAAPGGKSFAAAIAMGGRGEVVACDLHENKLRRIREGAERLGLSCITPRAADGTVFHPEWEDGFDAVLADVPCSGLGIIRKKPDVRYKPPDSLLPLAVTQAAILSNAARYVRPGGVLVYSTCTVLPEENGEQAAAFLAEHPGFSRESIVLPGPAGEAAELTLWPQRHGTDGFYICRMRRGESFL